MKALGLAFLMVLSLAAAPSAASADGRRGQVDGRRGNVRGEFNGSRRFDGQNHHRFDGQRHHHGFRNRSVFPLFVGPSVVAVSPFLDAPYASVPYPAPAPVYAAPQTYAAPAPPPVPRVVEFSTGRYELSGDGVYTPYAWIWIPNPPVAPPAPPPPAAPPGPPAAAPDPGPRRAPATLYRWTDEGGVTTWTDSLEKVPTRYREHARALTP